MVRLTTPTKSQHQPKARWAGVDGRARSRASGCFAQSPWPGRGYSTYRGGWGVENILRKCYCSKNQPTSILQESSECAQCGPYGCRSVRFGNDRSLCTLQGLAQRPTDKHNIHAQAKTEVHKNRSPDRWLIKFLRGSPRPCSGHLGAWTAHQCRQHQQRRACCPCTAGSQLAHWLTLVSCSPC
jgi:hypothetical protein